MLPFSNSIQCVNESSGFGRFSGLINLGNPVSSPATKSSVDV
jgi:hypothetical protein